MSTIQDYQAAELLLRRPARHGELVIGDKVRPQWIDGETRFWYGVRNGPGKRFVLVDPAAGTRERAEFTPLGNPLAVPSPNQKVAVSMQGHDLWARSLSDELFA